MQLSAIFALSALASLAVAVPQGPIQPCTTTLSVLPTIGCAKYTATTTSTNYVDCDGCSVLDIKTIGIIGKRAGDIVCPPKPTTTMGTKTVQAWECAPTA